MTDETTGEGTTETGTDVIPETELRETLALFKSDLQQQCEAVANKILRSYAEGQPLHQIRPLEDKLKQLEADIASFKQ